MQKNSQRSILPGLLIIVVLSVAAFFAISAEQGPEQAGLSAPGSVELEQEGPAAAPTSEGEEITAVDTPQQTERVPAKEAGEAPTAVPRLQAEVACVITGRTIDDAGAPLAGVDIQLQGYKVWAEGFDAPKLEARYELCGWRHETDELGVFRFEVPVPTSTAVWLTVEPDPFHGALRFDFGGKRRGALPALQAAERDLGDLVLATCGAIRGTVRDEEGTPIAGAKLDASASPTTTLGLRAETDAAGQYLVGGVPAGSYGLQAKADHFLSHFEKPLVVEKRVVTLGPDFILRRSPTLTGRVMDEAGMGLEGARLRGWPKSSGSGAGASSEIDGSFVVHLPQDEPYTLGVELKGYEPFWTGDQTLYEPGSEGIEIVLTADVMTRFVVVSKDDGQAIENFGLHIERNKGLEATTRITGTRVSPPRASRHAGGVLELGARPGLDRYKIVALGFQELRGEVAHDDDTDRQQTLRLTRGPSLVGRIVYQDAPVPGLPVSLTPGNLRKHQSDAGDTLKTFYLDAELRATAVTDEQGFFRFRGVERGASQELRAVDDSRGSLRVRIKRLRRSGEQDLGDLELVPFATISGEVRVPPETSLAGLEVRLGDWRQGVSTTTDAKGKFSFTRLPSGSHVLTVVGRPGVIDHGQGFGVEVSPGETRHIVLDVHDRNVSTVQLRIHIESIDLSGLNVQLRSVDAPALIHNLGSLDREGKLTHSLRAGGEWEVLLDLNWVASIVHPTARVQLEPGLLPVQELEFVCASASIRLPDGLVPPEEGRLEFDIGGQQRELPFPAIELRYSNPWGVFSDDRRVFHFSLISVGTHDYSVRLFDHAAPMADPDSNPLPVFELQGTATIVAGETVEILLD